MKKYSILLAMSLFTWLMGRAQPHQTAPQLELQLSQTDKWLAEKKGVEYLRSRQDIRKVVLLGHSVQQLSVRNGYRSNPFDNCRFVFTFLFLMVVCKQQDAVPRSAPSCVVVVMPGG